MMVSNGKGRSGTTVPSQAKIVPSAGNMLCEAGMAQSRRRTTTDWLTRGWPGLQDVAQFRGNLWPSTSLVGTQI